MNDRLFIMDGNTLHMEQIIKLPDSPIVNLGGTEARILTAAKELILAHGFSAISSNQLCKAARVSKTSIYKYYGDMAGVLAAIVKSEGDMFDLGVETEPSSNTKFWQAMFDYGVKVLNVLNEPFCIELVRILHEEARSKPELAKVFYENADKRCHGITSRLIIFGQNQGYIDDAINASESANHLVTMWQGMSFIEARLGLTKVPFENPEDWSRKCVIALYPEARLVLV